MGQKKQKRERFETLAMPHMDALYGAALRLTRNSGNAEDLVQDALLRAYRFWDSFKEDTSIKAWLFKIQTNLFYTQYSRRKRQREVLSEAQRAQEASDGVLYQEHSASLLSPEDALARQGFSKPVAAALDSLKDDYKVVVVLCDVSGFSYKEIAKIVDCPVGTVMSRLYRGRKQLQNLLRGHAADEGIIDLSQYRSKQGEAS